MAQRGGKRPGAGRKAGTVNKRSAAVAAKAAETGKLPHEILLDIARGAKVREPLRIEGAVITKNVPMVDANGKPVKDSDGKQVEETVPVMIERDPTVDEIIKCAVGAAPYYAPKLGALAVVPPNPESDPITELMALVRESGKNRAKAGA
jgi:hypothetical protein